MLKRRVLTALSGVGDLVNASIPDAEALVDDATRVLGEADGSGFVDLGKGEDGSLFYSSAENSCELLSPTLEAIQEA